MDNVQGEREITIIFLLEKIRAIDKQGDFKTFAPHSIIDLTSLRLEPYLWCLEKIQEQLNRYKMQEDQYKKLELALQRQETEIRKRISIEQQLKLYTEALKIQVQEIEKEKLQLLQNSKTCIKQLKSSNEKLYAKLSKAKGNIYESPQKLEKSRVNKSLSYNKPKHDKSIRQIIKTEYFDRNLSNSANKKKEKNKKQAYSTISAHQHSQGLHENSKTFHVVSQSNKKEKLNSHGSKKRTKYLFSNYTLLNYLQGSNKKFKKVQKSINLSKSPKKSKKQGKYNANKWKQKKPYKSILSVPSAQPSSSKKETN